MLPLWGRGIEKGLGLSPPTVCQAPGWSANSTTATGQTTQPVPLESLLELTTLVADMTVVTAEISCLLTPEGSKRKPMYARKPTHSKIDAHPCRPPDFLTLLKILHHPVTCQCSSCNSGIHGPVGTERCSGLHSHAHECKHQHCHVHMCTQF